MIERTSCWKEKKKTGRIKREVIGSSEGTHQGNVDSEQGEKKSGYTKEGVKRGDHQSKKWLETLKIHIRELGIQNCKKGI